ncbi:hypothetical protein PUNSTDRAFT_139376 [Punctularia strigosozonata HHB-11173 SS5]|uniref:F-box domain-containing protein n=1 Tax=Punctularia strigosozonata (strain HHB-11173) TaxID=741275 RepID=R7S1K0_PUNST|nr:uncharacterized protein PUNSTDRAFT_139376 [Punctularia strigosozonata HHB-11173 SS5]EIN03662.1 hypothetical protein PUNSTDRAFT_139376 [Punctularia strigosozonata HHB-11173 SS5]
MTLYIGISPPLSICGRPTADARSTALRNLDRAERLIFHGYEKDRSDEVHLSRSAPKLVRCVVDLEGGRVPHNFLGLYTPQLRSLELSNTRFDWDMISCKSLVGGLTLLKLEKLPKACCPSARELTAALMSMPVLRELKIDVYRYSGDDTPRPVVTDGPIGVVALEQLVSLSITGPRWLQIQTWLAHMKVARTAWLVLKPNPFQFDVVDPSALIAFLEDNVIFGGEEGAAVHRLVLHVSYTAVNRLDADRKRDPGGDWPYLLHLEGWFDTDRTLRALYKMRYDAMEFLELSLPPYFNPLHIRHILHRSPNLRELHLRGLETCNVVMPFLTVGTGEDSDGSSSDMPLPALGRIQLTVPQYEREEPHQGCLDLLVARFHASGPAFELVLQGVQHLPRRELRRVRRAVGDAEMLYMRNSGTLYVRKGDCALLPQDLAY